MAPGTPCSNRGDLRAEQGRTSEAEELLLKAIDQFRAVGDERGEAYAVLDLASVRGWQRRYEEAMASAERARELCLAIPDRRGVAWADLCLADLVREQGAIPVAADLYARCLPSFRDLGDHVGTAHLLLRRGIIQVRQGDAAAGHSSWRAALDLYAKARMPEAEWLREWLEHRPDETRMRGGIGRLRFPLDLNSARP